MSEMRNSNSYKTAKTFSDNKHRTERDGTAYPLLGKFGGFVMFCFVFGKQWTTSFMQYLSRNLTKSHSLRN